MNRVFSLLIVLILASTSSLFASYNEPGWYTTSFLGASMNLPSKLKIHKTDGDINHNAKWAAHSFKDSLYYAVRFEKWAGDQGKGIEWVHHKVYLGNPPVGVDGFSISDGFNLLLFNKAKKRNQMVHRMGAGFVLAHMDVTLTGRERFYMKGGMGGSYLAGVSAQYAVEKWLWENDRYFVNAEGKFTLSYVKGPISGNKDEYANVPNIAFHVLLGLGSKPAPTNADIKEKLIRLSAPIGYHLLAQYMPTEKL